MRKFLIGIAVVSAIAFTACTETDTPTYDPAPVGATSYEVTADDVVDAAPAGVVDTFCTLYDDIGSYDAALAAFADGYGTSQNPSAQEVFDEILSRC
jgi:hypothetical protein